MQAVIFWGDVLLYTWQAEHQAQNNNDMMYLICLYPGIMVDIMYYNPANILL